MKSGPLFALLAAAWLAAGAAGIARAQSAEGADRPAAPDPNLSKALTLTVKPSTGGPRPSTTGFGGALRCMDAQFRVFGVKNVPVIIEDIPDTTKKINAGAREMFVSATSQMTRASRAVRLIPYDGQRKVFQDLFKGQDDIGRKAAFAVQGSISQFDESLLRKQRDGGICLGPLCIGGADSDQFSGMSVDMSVLNVRDDLSLVPGAISKNFVLIRKFGKGLDADLNYKKFGINYAFVDSQSDGQGQALRNLIELSAIELYGRLLKIPYWHCLSVPDNDPGVLTEIGDWWEMLQADVPSLVSWLQAQMATRGLYKGEVNGEIDEALLRSVRAYKGALGLTADETLDIEFFRKYLTAKHHEVQPQAVTLLQAIDAAEGPIVAEAKPLEPAAPAASAAAAVVSAVAAPPAAAARAAVAVQGTKGAQHVYRRGESLDVEVAVTGGGFLYCFLIDDNRAITQFFPNPVQPSAAVPAGARLLFPGRFPFQILASSKGVTETVACFATPADLGQQVAVAPTVRDVPGLRQFMQQRAGRAVEAGVFDVRVQ